MVKLARTDIVSIPSGQRSPNQTLNTEELVSIPPWSRHLKVEAVASRGNRFFDCCPVQPSNVPADYFHLKQIEDFLAAKKGVDFDRVAETTQHPASGGSGLEPIGTQKLSGHVGRN